MVHQGQGLPFGLKAGHHGLRVHAQLDDLEGHLSADRFLLLGHIDDPTTTFPNLLEQLVTADAIARLFRERSLERAGMGRQRFGGAGQGRLCRTGSRCFGQELASLGLGLKQFFDFLAQRQIRPARLRQKRRPFPRVRNFHCLQEDVLHCL